MCRGYLGTLIVLGSYTVLYHGPRRLMLPSALEAARTSSQYIIFPEDRFEVSFTQAGQKSLNDILDKEGPLKLATLGPKSSRSEILDAHKDFWAVALGAFNNGFAPGAFDVL